MAMRAPTLVVLLFLSFLAPGVLAHTAEASTPHHLLPSIDLNDPSLDPHKATLDGSPADNLPPHIRQVLDRGMRPDWSPDGKSLVYLDGPLGDVWHLKLATNKTRNLTGRLDHFGFLRAHHLPNGDLVLCGPDHPVDMSAEEPGRFEGKLWTLPKPYTGEIHPLGRPCWEGVAVSRRANRIAWNESDIDFTSPTVPLDALTKKSEIWMGDIVTENGVPRLADVRLVATRQSTALIAPIEVQDFRGPSEQELIFTAYGYLTGEVMGYDLRTKSTTNYSNSIYYEEAEGTSPDGSFVLVERDLMVNPIPGALDFWRLTLEKPRTWTRLTNFNRYRGYGASNPVVSPDGRSVAFQMSITEGAEGEGAGLFVLDLTQVS
ncbi:hypothetical protein E7Z54_02545 [Nocardioides sp.]|nr:hypothetical protein E7Z54_02545 [Nocardioides sp.]